MDPERKAAIADYYDNSMRGYQLWHGPTYALHSGFWNEETTNRHEALLNTNRFVAEVANISPNDNVLDAGCGIGGTSIWLAKNYGVKVSGITLSQRQQQKAMELAYRERVSPTTGFSTQDFLSTNFLDSSFTVIVGVESISYAENKADFAKEAYRLLNPNGRLVIVDAFLKRPAETTYDEELLQHLYYGFELPKLTSIQSFGNDFRNQGFKNMKYWDKSAEVLPSGRQLKRLANVQIALTRLSETVKRVPEEKRRKHFGALVMHDLVATGLVEYGVLYAEKP